MSAWPELDGSPSRQVTRFHATAAASPAPITSVASDGATVDDAADRVGDRGADEQRPEQVEDRGQHDRLQRRRGPRGDERGDRVRCVVQPVGHREADREQDRDDEPRVHCGGLYGRSLHANRQTATRGCGKFVFLDAADDPLVIGRDRADVAARPFALGSLSRLASGPDPFARVDAE